MTQLGIKQSLIKRCAGYLSEAHTKSEARNRMVHDAWFEETNSKELHQFKGVTRKKLEKSEGKKIDVGHQLAEGDENIEDAIKQIDNLLNKLLSFQKNLSAELSTSHGKSRKNILEMIFENIEANLPQCSDQRVEFLTAAAPPPEAVLAEMREAGFNVTHVYGLTEVYGPSVVNEWKAEWDALDSTAQAQKKARQGVRYVPLEALSVMDPATMTPVPADGQTLGEVMFRGNTVMKGYLKNKAVTDEALAGGWFHSGDLGVTYPDGYIQLTREPSGSAFSALPLSSTSAAGKTPSNSRALAIFSVRLLLARSP